MSKYLYNTRLRDEYDARNAQQYEDAGSDLEDSEVYSRRPDLFTKAKKMKKKEEKIGSSDSDSDYLDMESSSEEEDDDSGDEELPESESDSETHIDYSIQYGIKDGPERAAAYRAAQLKSGADPATLDVLIATIDEVREVLSGKQGLSAAQKDEKLDALSAKLDRLEGLLDRRRLESLSVYNAQHEIQMAQYRAALLESGVSASAVESTIAALQQVEEFHMADVNYEDAEVAKKLTALHTTLTSLLEEIESKEADSDWVDGAITAVESAMYRAAQVKRGVHPDAIEAVITAVNKAHNILDDAYDYSEEKKVSKLAHLHEQLTELRDVSDVTMLDPSPINKAIADIEAFFEENGYASSDSEGTEEADNAELQSRISAVREELSSKPAKNTTLQAELARLESMAAALTVGTGEGAAAESARLHTKLVALRNSAVAQRAQLRSHGADASVIDAEIAHLDERIAKAHSGSLGSLDEHSGSDSDSDFEIESSDEEEQIARAQMMHRLEAKLDRLTAQRHALLAKMQQDAEAGEQEEEGK